MRKAINGLTAMVQERLKQDPFCGSIFCFCNKRRDIIKLLYWDRNGFCIWYKRLEKDRFPWPSCTEEALQITPQQMQWLLDGIDFRNAHKALHYTTVA